VIYILRFKNKIKFNW